MNKKTYPESHGKCVEDEDKEEFEEMSSVVRKTSHPVDAMMIECEVENIRR